MNALWLERLYAYRSSPLALESAKVLLALKDESRSSLLRRYGQVIPVAPYTPCRSVEEVLLCEARNARSFWKGYRALLPLWCAGFARRPRAADNINRLLDVGYHRLAGMVENSILDKGISPAPGLIHRAHRAKGKPLVYDLMEIFRADMVDSTLLKFLRRKKTPLRDADHHTAHFLSEMHKRAQIRFYLRDFSQCHTYSYYMELQALKFIKAVNRKEIFEPVRLPRRHEMRCSPRNSCPACRLTSAPSGSPLSSGRPLN